ncbi:MAG: hypothetical protein LBL33_07280 [Tannerella sp.]|nr:hypothetical protein [Tannerella sp.]
MPDRPAIDKIKRITHFFYLPRRKLKESVASFVSRGRVVKNRVALEVAANEMRRVIKCDPTARFFYKSLMRDMERIKKQINGIEQKISGENRYSFVRRKPVEKSRSELEAKSG